MLKFGQLVGQDDQVFRYSDQYAVESTTGPERLLIGPSADHLSLLVDLAATWCDGSYFLLYVLLVSRQGNHVGRYESPGPLDLPTVRKFCSRFAPFLENDGRHHFWIGSTAGEGTLVYDQHNVIYAYGELSGYKDVLRRRGMSEGPVRFPAPHSHHYHASFDGEEANLLAYWAWRHLPLQANDEY